MHLTPFLLSLASYLLGSIPTAVLVSKYVAGVDIRTLGDGNMGARNTFRNLGWKPGMLVALTDACKAAIPTLVARYLDLPPAWLIVIGSCAVLGHDFPIFARFQGGQGMASIYGVLFVLMPIPTAIGLFLHGVFYLFLHHSDVAAAIGIVSMLLLAWLTRLPLLLIGSAVALILSMPLKKWLDSPRRERNAGTLAESPPNGDEPLPAHRR